MDTKKEVNFVQKELQGVEWCPSCDTHKKQF